MQKKDPFQNEIGIERKLAKDIADKIMSLDPIKIEWIKLLIKQWLDALSPETRARICKDIFQVLLNNGIIDESAIIPGSSIIMYIEGHAVWFHKIAKFLEKNS